MPLTPFHLGPGMFLGAIFFKFFNLWALLIGSVIVDLEPFLFSMINLQKGCRGCPDHFFLHSILGAIFGSLLLAGILWKFKEILNKISLNLKIKQSFSFQTLFFSSLTAWLMHIFFDSLTHPDVFLFWPIKSNPTLIGRKLYWPLSFSFLFLAILAIGLLLIRLRILKKKEYGFKKTTICQWRDLPHF